MPDGSASCIIGTLDLLTRTTWRLEIDLPADQAGFSTRSFWHNGSGAEQPYYTWMNVGIKASGNLQFINPGTQYLGHDGNVLRLADRTRPTATISPGTSRITSAPTNRTTFLAVWPSSSAAIGMTRTLAWPAYAAYADKPGRKIWIWGLVAAKA